MKAAVISFGGVKKAVTLILPRSPGFTKSSAHMSASTARMNRGNATISAGYWNE